MRPSHIAALLVLILCLSWLAAAATVKAHEPLDLTKLPLGDGKISTEPRAGWIWACRIDPNAGGAHREGPWIDEAAGTFDLTAKAVVDGEVTWPYRFSITREGSTRVIATNDLPTHPTGQFPISRQDDAYQYDRNPNSIRAQDIVLRLPTEPTLAARPRRAPGAVGVLVTGVALFSAIDAPGRDAVAHETQDACMGHPQRTGAYHYHNLTPCLEDPRDEGEHSGLVGYAIDGFGIYGPYGEGGVPLVSADLDECHGHVHEIDWDGRRRAMFHYHATPDFPYTLGCLRGTYERRASFALDGGPGVPPAQGAARRRTSRPQRASSA